LKFDLLIHLKKNTYICSMKKLNKFILACIFLFTLSSCCTKKGCSEVQNSPNIYLTFTGFQLGYDELDYITPFLYSNADNSLIDSSYNSYPKVFNAYSNSNLLEYFPTESAFQDYDFFEDLKQSYIVIKTPVRSDTIYQFDFSVEQEKIRCNACDKKTDRYTIQNFSFYHKGIQYFDGDTVNIIK